jgi:hypothetical protein
VNRKPAARIRHGAFAVFVVACNVGGVPPVDPALGHAPTPQQVSDALGESSRRSETDGQLAVLGWHVEVSGDRVRWRKCESGRVDAPDSQGIADCFPLASP